MNKNIIKYKAISHNKFIVYCMVDRVSAYQTDWTREIIKNLSDYVLSSIISKGYDVFIGIDEDMLLQEASQNYNHAVVLSTGSEFIWGNNWFKQIEEFCKQYDFFLLGHLISRDEGCYELHEQCYLINLYKFNILGKPLVGQFDWQLAEQQNSSEIIYEDYSPVRIRPYNSINIKNNKHKWHGWNLLNIAFNSDLPVFVFGNGLKQCKKYYYPNDEFNFMNSSLYLYYKLRLSSQALFYPFNTENVVYEKPISKPIRQLICPASGLNWIEYLLYYGFESGTIIRFIDYSIVALEYMSGITAWDGNDYEQFLVSFGNSKTKFLGLDWKSLLNNSYKLSDKWQSFISNKDWMKLWQDIKNNCKFEFKHIDLVLDKDRPICDWVNEDLQSNTLILLSHIFNYEPNAVFLSFKHRLYLENALIEKLKEHIPDAYIIFYSRSCSGFTEINCNDLAGRLSEIRTIDIDQCQRPTWHPSSEW